MRVVVQRVSRAQVTVGGEITGKIGKGIVALAAFSPQDSEKDLEWMAKKVVELRIFEDDQGKMNLSLQDAWGQLLVVSQFTLYGDCMKGRRPSFIGAAPPAEAEKLYDKFIEILRKLIPDLQTGIFQASMTVEIVNSGPVTLILDNHGIKQPSDN
jgi:D-aminoacyl-tRNA deacylase